MRCIWSHRIWPHYYSLSCSWIYPLFVGWFKDPRYSRGKKYCLDVGVATLNNLTGTVNHPWVQGWSRYSSILFLPPSLLDRTHLAYYVPSVSVPFVEATCFSIPYKILFYACWHMAEGNPRRKSWWNPVSSSIYDFPCWPNIARKWLPPLQFSARARLAKFSSRRKSSPNEYHDFPFHLATASSNIVQIRVSVWIS